MSTPTTPPADVAVQVLVEVAGCPTTCMHCWALGGNYGAMRSTTRHSFCSSSRNSVVSAAFSYRAYPMHEVTAHPAAPDIIRLFAPHLGESFDPILTPGTPLASREDWKVVIAAARSGSPFTATDRSTIAS